MHHLIVWQKDADVEAILQPLISRGAGGGVVQLGGDHFRLFQMISTGSPKGEWYDRLPIWSAIMSTARHALQTQDRLARMHIIFMFHQTSQAAVKSIMGALKLLTPDALDGLAQSLSKNLHVEQVVLLSCESAADKTAPQPVPPAMVRWVNQARDMRNACFEAFTIRHINGGIQFTPVVATFSTGNIETGGVVLNPWSAKFISLRGHFDANGDWDYDLDANGNPDKTQTDSGGTLFADTVQGSATQTSFNAGQVIPPLLPVIPPP